MGTFYLAKNQKEFLLLLLKTFWVEFWNRREKLKQCPLAPNSRCAPGGGGGEEGAWLARAHLPRALIC